MRVLVTGISSTIGRLLTQALVLRGDEVFGIDQRPSRDLPDGVEVVTGDLRKRAAAELVRHVRPEAIVHMATVTHLFEQSEERYRVNLEGTRALFDYAESAEVPHVVFVGRHTYYGAAADTAFYHHEYEPPVQVGDFPELADLVAADLYASTALWRLPAIATSVLRVPYTLGVSGRGTLGAFLRPVHRTDTSPLRVPLVLGYDPLFQFLHELDLVHALVACLDARPHGVFNVAGPTPLPLSRIITEAGRKPLPLPEGLLRRLLGRFGLPKLSPAALDHLKFSITIDDSRFRAATGYSHVYDGLATLGAYRAAFP